MDKPLSLRRADFNEALAKAITEAELPPFIIADCLQFTLLQVQDLATQQYQHDKIAYEKACNNEEEVKACVYDSDGQIQES